MQKKKLGGVVGILVGTRGNILTCIAQTMWAGIIVQ